MLLRICSLCNDSIIAQLLGLIMIVSLAYPSNLTGDVVDRESLYHCVSENPNKIVDGMVCRC